VYMAEVRSSGPRMGQLVIYTQTQSAFYPTLIVTPLDGVKRSRLYLRPPPFAPLRQINHPCGRIGSSPLPNTAPFVAAAM
jgi:hypothetical protein